MKLSLRDVKAAPDKHGGGEKKCRDENVSLRLHLWVQPLIIKAICTDILIIDTFSGIFALIFQYQDFLP